MAKKDLTKVISSQRKHLDSVTQKKVVDELLDELTLHALQLQQISNGVVRRHARILYSQGQQAQS